MMRRDMFKALTGAVMSLPLLKKVIPHSELRVGYTGVPMQKVEGSVLEVHDTIVTVSTLEVEGWSFCAGYEHAVLPCLPFAKPNSLEYYPRWYFHTREEAEEFVCNLMPELHSVTLANDLGPDIDSIRSGYRGAVRAQFRGDLRQMEVKIVQRQKDGTYKDMELNRPLFWTIADAWGWLSNIRIDGQPVNRPGKGARISEYLIQPFRKGTPTIKEISYVNGKRVEKIVFEAGKVG